MHKILATRRICPFCWKRQSGKTLKRLFFTLKWVNYCAKCSPRKAGHLKQTSRVVCGFRPPSTTGRYRWQAFCEEAFVSGICQWLRVVCGFREMIDDRDDRKSQDALLQPQLLTVRRCRHTRHLSHIQQRCSQFPPIPRLPLRHQGQCLLSQRQLLLHPKGCFQILCLPLVTSMVPASAPIVVSCPKGNSYSCEGIDPFQKGCSLLAETGTNPPMEKRPKAPKRQLLLLSRQLSSQLPS